MSIIEAHTQDLVGRLSRKGEREEWKSNAGSRELFVTQVDYLRYKTTLADNVLPEQGVDPTARRRRMRTLLICCCCATNARRMQPKWLPSNQLFSNKDVSLSLSSWAWVTFLAFRVFMCSVSESRGKCQGIGCSSAVSMKVSLCLWKAQSKINEAWTNRQLTKHSRHEDN